jgi:hypothetical protein
MYRNISRNGKNMCISTTIYETINCEFKFLTIDLIIDSLSIISTTAIRRDPDN